jgi:uncharacterized protein with von Willebrand factor type A (vWA) domain
MPTLTIHYETEAERLAYERAIAFAAELHRLGQDSPAAEVVDACEALALDRGRRLLRDGLAAAVQARVDRDEQKGATPRPSPAAMPGGTRGGGPGRP